MKITHKLTFGLVDFFERQMQTKTGRYAVAAILGAWTACFRGALPWQAAALASLVSLQSMLLRDKEAKAEAIERKKSKRVYRGGGKSGDSTNGGCG